MKNPNAPSSGLISIPGLRGMLTAFLMLLATCAAHGQAFSNAVMSLNPVGYWPLQETTQPPAANIEPNLGSLGSIANMYYATNSVSYLASVVGPMGGLEAGMKFINNNAAYAIVPTTDNRVSLPPGGPFTVEVWAQPFGYGQYNCVVSQSGNIPAAGNNASTNKGGWMLGQNYYPSLDDGSGTFSGALYGWSFSVFNGQSIYGGANCIAPFEYTTNTWYYLVGVFDGVNTSLYINGVLASSFFEAVPMPLGTSFTPDTWDPIEVACSRGVGGNSINPAEGVAEFSIYTNALSATTISNHYNASQLGYSYWVTAVSNSNPYMYYQMQANPQLYRTPDPATCPTAANYGSAAANMTNLAILARDNSITSSAVYQPGTLPGVAGPSYQGFGSPSYACAFNALGGAVDVGTAPVINPTGSNSVGETFVAWFKTAPCDDNGRWNTIGSHADNSWRAKINNGNTVWDSGGGPDFDIYSPIGAGTPNINVNDGNWHMYVGEYSPPSNNILCIDGCIYATALADNSITGNTNYDAWIGGAPDHVGTGGGAQQYFAGNIAHVAYFNYALTTNQITYLYSASEAPPMIITQPASYATAQSGNSTATFSVTASAATNGLLYQWYFNNGSGPTALVGQNATNLVLSGLADNNSGSYFVVISNSFGVVTSSNATLTVSTEAAILSQVPGSTLTLFSNQNYTLSVNAVGSNIIYQWYTNGVADTTAGTTSAYALTGVQPSMTGNTYQCVVGNSLNTVSNQATTLTVLAIPTNITAGGSFGSNVLALNPTTYWPMHETAPGVQGDVEINLGTLGSIANAYYADWDPSNVASIVEMNRQVPPSITGEPVSGDTALYIKRSPCSFLTISHQSPQTTIKPPFTVEVWVDPDDQLGGSLPLAIVGQGGGAGWNSTGRLGGFDLEYGAAGSKSNCFSMEIYTGNGGASDQLTTPISYPPGQWYHVAASYDGTNIAMYINGQQVTSFIAGTTTTSMSPDFWSPLVIGGGKWNGNGPGNNYQGYLSEVAIYTNVLAANVVRKHYSDGTTSGAAAYASDVSTLNPLLYYRMNAPTYTPPPRSTWPVLNNYGSFATNGVYLPGVYPGTLGGLGLANVGSTVSTPFNGNGGTADAGMGPQLNPLGYSSFSYMAFFRGFPNDTRSFTALMAGNDSSWRCMINGSGQVRAHATTDLIETNVICNDGNWHFVVVTGQAGNNNANNVTNLVYVDGVLVTNAVSGSNNPAASPGPEAILGNEYGEWVQVNQSALWGEERTLAGSICEAAFFNGQVLTAGQISNLYAAAGVAPYFTYTNGMSPYYTGLPFVTNVNQGSVFTFGFGSPRGSSANVSYQWYSNNVPMLTQTNQNLSLNPVQANSAGIYYVTATTSFGSANSPLLQITVSGPPQIVNAVPPESGLQILASATLDFNVTAAGAVPLKYYWYSNSVLIAATNTSFILSNVTANNAGTYSVIVSNSLGTATNTWFLSVVPVSGSFVPAVIALGPIGFWPLNEPGDGMNPTNSGVCHDYINGNDGIYENAVTGLPGYNWIDSFAGPYDTNTAAGFGTTYGLGQNSCALNISNIVVSSPTNGEFTVQCWAQGTAKSTLNTPNLVSKGLYNHEQFALDCGNHVGTPAYAAYRFEVRNQTTEATFNANSSVVAAGDTNWHFIVGVCDQIHSNVLLYIDGTNAGVATITPGAGIDNSGDSIPVMIGARTSGAYNLNGMDQQFSGNIADVAIFNYALTSNQITAEYLAAGVGPSIIQQPPATTNVDYGANLTVAVTAEGTGTLYYQWFDTNAVTTVVNPIPGETSATLSLTNVTASDTYFLQVSNVYGTNVSSNITVTAVAGPPTVESEITPTNAAVLYGGNIALSAVVDGSQPISYGWQLNGAPVFNNSRISGANSSVLVITDAQFSDAGSYVLLATNGNGTSNTLPATLDVIPYVNFSTNGPGFASQFYSTGTVGWLGDDVLQLTDQKGNEDAAVFFNSRVYVGGFEAWFIYQDVTGPTGSADGVTFCVQNDPRGTAAIGGGGGSLGVGTGTVPGQTFGGQITPSFEFEFNIYAANPNGGLGVSLDSGGNIGPNVAPGGIVVNSGDPIATEVNYFNGVATVYLMDMVTSNTYSLSTNVNIPTLLGTNMAYVGFTAADGGSSATQTITDFQFVSYVTLAAQLSGGNLILSWPQGVGDYVLQSTPSLSSPHWTNVVNQPVEVGQTFQVTLPAPGAPAYYRLNLVY